MNPIIPIIILAAVIVISGSIYLYRRSESSTVSSSSSSPSTPRSTTPVPSTPRSTTPVPSIPRSTTPAPSIPAPSMPRSTTPAPYIPAPPVVPPVDCQVSNWSQGLCSKECGGGIQTQTRNITVQPRNGGRECPPLTQTKECNEQLCQECKYLNWSKCDCLTKKQTRAMDPSSSSFCTQGQTSQSCTPDDCEWYGFDTTYVSGGQYYDRRYVPDFESCYRSCEKPNCAAVYAYDGPGNPYNNNTNRNWVECNLIDKENVDVLYKNYNSPTALIDGKNRHAFVNSKLAGDKFRSDIGTSVIM